VAVEADELASLTRARVEQVTYEGQTATVTIVTRSAGDADAATPQTFVCPIPLERRRRRTAPAGRLPRVSRWMALALHFDDLVGSGTVEHQVELARLGHVSPARVSQIMNLMHLAPDSQEQLLFLPLVDAGRDPLLLRQLQPLAATLDWDRQRRKWLRLARRGS
jgi:hypothetical protein